MPIDISKKRGHLPSRPGIYFFKNPQGKTLYIGKANNLKQRVSSYFQGSTLHTPAKIKMLQEAADIVWQETESEIEALITEAFLIKRHRPRYNILMRDDKNYYFAAFTKDTFPRIFLTHQPFSEFQNLKNSAKGRTPFSGKIDYIGPFTEGASIRSVLRALRRIFPYCTCTQKHPRYCQNSSMNLCIGDCCIKNPERPEESKKQYRKNIANIKKILQGKQRVLLKELEQEMEQAGESHDFELAARVRDQIRGLERIFAHSRVIKMDMAGQNQKALVELQMLLRLPELPERIEGYDISNIQGKYAVGSMVVFENGVSNKDEYRKFKIKTISGANDPDMIHEILTRRFRHPEWPLPNIILIDGGRSQLNAALRAKKEAAANLERDIRIISLAKRDEELYLPRRARPLKLHAMPTHLLHLMQQVRDEAHRFAINYYRKLHSRE